MGATSSVVGTQVRFTEAECKTLTGQLFDQTVFDENKDSDQMISLQALQAACAQRTDVFLTHDWGMELGRDNHERARKVNRALKSRGLKTWFDEEKMEGNVKQKMVAGIENASCILVFVTKRYMDKVGGNNAEDNCFLEFNYASRRKTANKMVSIVMEERMRNTANWTGILGLVLGGALFVDFSSDDGFEARMDELYSRIVATAGNTIDRILQSPKAKELMERKMAGLEGGGSSPAKAAVAVASDSSQKPLAKERSDEEHRAASNHSNEVCFLRYKLEAGKGLVISLETGQDPKQYQIIIRLKDPDRLDWTDSRIIAKMITFCERFTAFTKASLKEFIGKMEEEGNLIDSTAYSNQGSVFVTDIKPKSGSIAAQNPVGRVAKQSLSVDGDGDWTVTFLVEGTIFTVVISHNETNRSVSTLSAKALADVIYRSEPGDKLDDFMFLQHCARWRKKFNLLKIKRQNGGNFWVHIVPTSLTETQAGLSIESNVSLPAVTEEMDWAPETAARAKANDGGDNATPIDKERIAEERRATTNTNEVVCFLRYKLEAGKGLVISLETGQDPKQYQIIIRLKDPDELAWTDSRCIAKLLAFCERFTSFNRANLKEFIGKMEEEGNLVDSVSYSTQGSVFVVDFKPKPGSIAKQNPVGRVAKQSLSVDSDGDWQVVVIVEDIKYTVIVAHSEKNNSIGTQSAKALADAIYRSEPGDKLDDFMFLQHCARWRKKFNLVKVRKQNNGGFWVHMMPTLLAEAETGLTIESNVDLPAVTEDMDWAPETAARAKENEGNDQAPIDRERTTEERRASSNSDNVVCFLRYKLEAGKGLVISLETGQDPKQYQIIIRLKDPEQLDWTDSRIIAKTIAFCERFTAFTKASLKEFIGKMEEEGNLIDSTAYSNQGSVFVTDIKPKPGSISSMNPVGRVAKQSLSVDSDGDWQVVVIVEDIKYTVIVAHSEKNNSIGTQSAKALADAIYRSEPGDKLDDFMFLQHCARWRKKFNLVKVRQQNNGGFWVHMMPTLLSESATGLTIESNIDLPAVTEELVWAPETAARAKDDADAGLNPLDRERASEERRASKNTSNVVCFLRYKLDSDKDFVISVEIGQDPKYFTIIVRLKDVEQLDWTESRVLAKLITFCERFTAFTKDSLKEFITKLEEEDLVTACSYSTQGSNNSFVAEVRPKPGSIAGQNPIGRVAKQSLSVDSDGDWQVVVIVEDIKYTVIVAHSEKNNSISTQSAKALADVIYRSEPGDKLDDFMFLQHCARWRKRFNLVKVRQQNNGGFWVHMMPTLLSESATGLTIESNVDLPAVTEEMDWAPATTIRANGGTAADEKGGDSMRAIVTDTSNAVSRDRAQEETKYDRALSSNAESITRIIYKIDRNEFLIQLHTGKVKSNGFALRIVVDDFKSMTWPESRCIKDCLKMVERFNDLSTNDFDEAWPQKLAEFDHVAKITKMGMQSGMQTHRITPANASKTTAWAHVRKQSLSFDADVWKVDIETDKEHLVFAVDHYVKDSERSFAMLQGRALADVLFLTEAGDKMDMSIFLKIGTLLKKKYHLVASAVLNAIPTIQIIPVDEDMAIAWPNQLEFLAMAEGEKLDWLPRTYERIAAAEEGYHLGFTCDGCRKGDREFGGRRYHCVECSNYDLCGTCFNDQIETAKHRSSHAMQMFDVVTAKGAAKTNEVRSPSKTASTASDLTNSSPSHSGGVELPVFGNGRVVTKSLLKMSGQASVYRGVKVAKDSSTIDVAIKVYHNTTDWQECKDELMVLLSLGRHDHVVQVLDFYEVPKPCFVMRMVDGGDLRDYLEKNGAIKPRARALTVIKGICAGLKHLHDHDVVHRDLKSPNILIVQPDMRPVLIDLGLGKVTGDGATQMTVNVKGSFLWMAPEMLSETKWSYKTDIFALGIIMWEIFSGKLPYEAKNLAITGLLLHIMGGGRPDLSLLSSGLAEASDITLMQQCWATDSADRPTIDQTLARL